MTYEEAIKTLVEESCYECAYGTEGAALCEIDCSLKDASKLAIEALKKLAHYEDLDEQGRLTEAPCKVGDTVYFLDRGKIKQGEVFEISIHSDGILLHTGTQFCLEVEQMFLTKAEAEVKLAELKGGEQHGNV